MHWTLYGNVVPLCPAATARIGDMLVFFRMLRNSTEGL